MAHKPELVEITAKNSADEDVPMWRVRRADGSLSDLANKTRAADALRAIERKES